MINLENISKDLIWRAIKINGKPTAIYTFDRQCPNELCSIKLRKFLNSVPRNISWTQDGLRVKDYAPKQKVTPIKKHLTLIGYKVYREDGKR